MKRLFSGMWLAALLLLSGCQAHSATDDGKLQIVTTFYPVYEFTRQIVGEDADVSLLIQAGTEPHDFEPSTRDIAQIQDADVFVYENENMETWVDSVQKSLDTKRVQVIKATKGLVLLPGGEEEHEHEHSEAHHHDYDPHLWLSPYRTKLMVQSIRDQLIAHYPERKAAFNQRAAAYLQQLSQLDEEYQAAFSHAKRREFVTQHTAFTYLALDYGLKQVSITGVSGAVEPSAARLAELTDFITKYQLKYVYFEENASQAIAQTLATETGVELEVLNPLESLSKSQQAAGVDYLSVMRENLAALQKSTGVAGAIIQDKEEKQHTVANGYFDDAEVENRSLQNFAGDWQSVYPYLQDGTLDQVMDYKAKLNRDRSAVDYKDYYAKGYKTDVETIRIDAESISFTVQGKTETYRYRYKGYQVLTYAAGNRGVRYLFEAEDADAGRFRYVQFSDHGIKNAASEHFHLYFGGDGQDALLAELEHWPTYYPAEMTGFDIAQEMVAH